MCKFNYCARTYVRWFTAKMQDLWNIMGTQWKFRGEFSARDKGNHNITSELVSMFLMALVFFKDSQCSNI